MALTKQQQGDARIMRAQGETADRIASLYGVRPSDVRRIKGVDWTDPEPADDEPADDQQGDDAGAPPADDAPTE